MADELPFLSRWSRRKVEARQEHGTLPAEPAPASVPAPLSAEAPAAPPLPPVESLTPASDFTPFLKPGVDEGLKRQALRALFRDPQFNIQDGLDIYIGDYTQPDPIPAEMLARLNQMSHLGVRERDPEPAPATMEVPVVAAADVTGEGDAPALPAEPAMETGLAAPVSEGHEEPRPEGEETAR